MAPDVTELGAQHDTCRDSGWISSSQTTTVPLPDTVTAREHRVWRVQIRIADGHESAWSDPTWFECGLPDDAFEGEWIAAPNPEGTDPAPVPALRKHISLRADASVSRARLYLAGLGSSIPSLDDERIGDRELDPACSDYADRIHYSTYDLTDSLTETSHVLGMTLGRGWYAMATETSWGWHQAPWNPGRPELLAQLEITYDDGETETITTDASWEARATQTTYDCLFAGEDWDGRIARTEWTDAEGWEPVEVVPGPDGTLEPQELPPMRETHTLTPEQIEEIADGRLRCTFPSMTVGTVAVEFAAPEGREITIRQGEKLDEDGRVDLTQGFVEAEIQTDTLIASDAATDRWQGEYSFKGFRYAEISGLDGPEQLHEIRAREIHTDFDTLGSEFSCSDTLLQQIHENARRGLRINYQGTPTDSPKFEMSSWTGDVQLACEGSLYNFDMANAYRKWLRDCADAQRADGELPPIVPTSGWGYEDSELGGLAGVLPGWDAAYVLVAWWCYRFYGDQRFIAEHYDGLRKLVEYFHGHAEDGVLRDGLGDWVPPGSGILADEMRPPEGPAISSTAYYYQTTSIVARIAEILGDVTTSRQLQARSRNIRDSFNDTFFDEDRGCYRTGEVTEFRQTSNILPLAFGMVPKNRRDCVKQALLADIEDRDRHVNTGILGTKYVLPTVTALGAKDIAFEMATQRTYPSWGRWIEEGATALYESWELNSRSRNHRSLASIEDWFYKDLAGIRPRTAGFETVSIEPIHPSGLDQVAATVDTVQGEIACAWERSDDEIVYEIELPAATPAVLTTPSPVTVVSEQETPQADPSHTHRLHGGSWRLETRTGE